MKEFDEAFERLTNSGKRPKKRKTAFENATTRAEKIWIDSMSVHLRTE